VKQGPMQFEQVPFVTGRRALSEQELEVGDEI